MSSGPKARRPLTSRLMTPVLVDARSGHVTHVVALRLISTPWRYPGRCILATMAGLPLKILWTLFDVIAIIVLGSGLYLWMAKRISRSARTDLAAAEAVLMSAK